MSEQRMFGRVPAVALILALLAGSAVAAPAAAADAGPWGYRVQRGAALDGFRLPTDVRLGQSRTDPRTGLVFERYQQLAAPLGVPVDGAQLSVVRRSGDIVLVIGRHYPGLRASARPSVAPVNASSVAARNAAQVAGVRVDPAQLATRRSELRVDPETRRLFYLVESAASGVRVFTEVDARTGEVLDAWNGLDTAEPGMGTGVKKDRKNLKGGAGTGDNLTSQNSNGKWIMRSPDGRFVTLNADNGYRPLRDARYGGDNDNDWAAGAERAGVDAQYYARLSYDFFLDRFGFDLLEPPAPQAGWCQFDTIESVVHVGYRYDNAFWDGYSLNYGDGDRTWTTGMSGGQDVVTHEFGHAVTECRVPLDYNAEPGALNESFSDIMATAAEWAIAEPLSSRCRLDPGQTRCADWWLGEDVVIGGPWNAFRSLADPDVLDQPSHYADRYKGTDDNGGVHSNSGIPNHAFYLMVEGGRNARCAGPAEPPADCGVLVPAIGMDHAAQLVFAAWGLLSDEAKLCEARDATVEAARLLYPGSAFDLAAADLAWRAVGVGPCASAPFRVVPSTRSVVVQPQAAPVDVSLTLLRGNASTTEVELTVSDPAPAIASLAQPATLTNNNDVIMLTIDPAGAPSGLHPITVEATDGTPNVEPALVSLMLIVDGDAPSTQIDQVRISPTGTVSPSGQAPIVVTWSAGDPLSGVVSGGAEPSLGAIASGSKTISLAPGNYQFSSFAADAAGNSATSAVDARMLSGPQESSATFAGGWTTVSRAKAWNGTLRHAKKRGASATFAFTGTDVAWIAQRGPKRGRARVFVDNVLVTTVDLYAGALHDRRVVFSATGLAAGLHTLRIVVRGTSGRPRVDVDGFAVLAPAP